MTVKRVCDGARTREASKLTLLSRRSLTLRASWWVSAIWSATRFCSFSFSASISNSVRASCRGRRSTWPFGVFLSMSWQRRLGEMIGEKEKIVTITNCLEALSYLCCFQYEYALLLSVIICKCFFFFIWLACLYIYCASMAQKRCLSCFCHRRCKTQLFVKQSVGAGKRLTLIPTLMNYHSSGTNWGTTDAALIQIFAENKNEWKSYRCG